MYKTIFHLDDEENITKVIGNINNLFKDMEEAGDEVEIEILANSNGVKAFKRDKEENKEDLAHLLEKGTEIMICNNTLNKLELSKEDLIDGIHVVTSGVGELTRKQNEGWAFIKP